MSSKIDISALPVKIGTLYPPPHHRATRGREKRALGDAVGLTQFGVNLTRLVPGQASALPHWHEKEDEFVYVLEGTATLIYGDTEEILNAGDCTGFKAGEDVAHCIENRSDADVMLLEVGSRIADEKVYYPGLDLMADNSGANFYYHLDGRPVADIRRRGPTDD